MKAESALTVFEHTSVPIAVAGPASVSAREADDLLHITATRRGFCSREPASVRLAQHCGLVPIGSRVAEVLPKTYRTSGASSAASRLLLLRMLNEARRVRLSVHATAAHDLARSTLLDVFATAFLDSVATVVRGGLQRRYVACSDDLGFVRGRIDMNRQLGALSARPDRIACRFDTLLEDHDWNRVLKAALLRLRATTSSAVIARRSGELVAAFVDVGDLRPATALSIKLRFDRQFERYRDAIGWAKLILAAASPSLRAGSAEAAGLLFDMNKLFEDVIGRRLTAVARVSGSRVLLQRPCRHLARFEPDDSPAFKLKPDIVISAATEVRCVADTKWKLLKVARDGRIHPSEDDVYQMLAYGTTYDVEDLALIYPWHPGVGDVSQATYRLVGHGRGHRLRVVFVDIESRDYPLRDGSSLLDALIGCKSQLHARPK